ncbi:pullulanase/glycogen debranching enzyme [Rhodopirellula rubra]|uniref:Pullulanase/glycogen debranching enzyme n=1 Tax=Aporhodopirellula rubra TaxID=980271 RepID=A0A7W5E2V5_9BACT|nr:alpha-amylase family glycosyl hydrolase [Aporhodopirellula rubra]MBB3209210.1 pullulanase/glycogen debranching enzyme [Aporhodopirellula rubra]
MKSHLNPLLMFVALAGITIGSISVGAADPTIPTSTERTQGHRFADETTVFIFDESVYDVDPSRVVVTGSFRGWSTDMDEAAWQLQPSTFDPTLWTLSVPNPNGNVIIPSAPFKFRIDDGQWLEPPADALNREGGNLVHRPGFQAVRMTAEILRSGLIHVRLQGGNTSDGGETATRPLEAREYRLSDALGNTIVINAVSPINEQEALLIPAERIDAKRVHYLELPAKNLRSLCRFDGWFRDLYSNKPLGANVAGDGSSTTWRMFAPRATGMRLYLYSSAMDKTASRTIDMTQDDDGIWEASVPGDQHGVYYDFTVHGPPDPGNFFYETHQVHISDPYARVSLDSFGKCRVWKPTTPATPLKNGRPAIQDVVAYEVHVEDFTGQLPVDEAIKGTFPAMTKTGLTNELGQPIGFDYLVNLGINVVHLMPVQEFLHYPDDQWQTAFQDDPYMIAAGVNESNYQWGYRTTHAFAIESRFRKRGTPNGAQRDQFRDLVQAFHDHDIAVIIDLVPNHTGENMDGRHFLFNFNTLDLPYYYRTDEQVQHIGPFGNEIKTEDRPMVQRWLIDQCKQLIDEFGIDGYRIDLAGQIDKQTLKRLRHELGPDVIVYGEPWIAPSDPDVANNPDLGWYKEDAPITYFQDDARNAFKGPTSNPTDKKTDRGYAGGDATQRERVQLALTNGFEDEIDPTRGINYLDIHDNWALADQFATTNWDGRQGVDERRFKLAAGLLFTSLGPIVMHGGTEMMRSKGAAELKEVIKSLPDGDLAYHGKSDTYNLRFANEFSWDNVGRAKAAPGSKHDYAGMVEYWKGLIQLRMSEAGRAFRLGRVPAEDYYQWILPDDPHLLGYLVDESILVLMNTSDADATFTDIELPDGRWRLVANPHRVDITGGVKGLLANLVGGRPIDIPVEQIGMNIWVRDRNSPSEAATSSKPADSLNQSMSFDRPWNEDVIYFAMTDRFCDGDKTNNIPAGSDPTLHDPTQKDIHRYHGGDLRGIERAIADGYFNKLGVTTLWLTPPVKNAWRSPYDLGGPKTGYHGYWTQDFLDIDPHLTSSTSLDGSPYADDRDGRMSHYKDVVSLAHAHGLKVIQDVVCNHIGPLFFYDQNGDGRLNPNQKQEWIAPYTSSAYTNTRWTNIPDWNLRPPQPAGPLSVLGKPVEAAGLLRDFHVYGRRGFNSDSLGKSDGEEVTCDFFSLRDLATGPDEAHFDALVDEFVAIYAFYIDDIGVDGLRLDTVKHVHHEFWTEFTSRLRERLGPKASRLLITGEVYDGNPRVLGRYTYALDLDSGERTTETCLDSLLNFQFCFSLRDYLRKPGDAFGDARGLARTTNSFKEKGLAGFYNSKPGADGLVPRQKMVNFFENHDGLNRFLVSDIDATKHSLALTIMMTSEGIPCLYYGTEAALRDTEGTSQHDSETGRMTFCVNGSRQTLDSAKRSDSFELISHLSDLRREYPVLQTGRTETLWVDQSDNEADDGLYVFARYSTNELGVDTGNTIVIAVNANPHQSASAADISLSCGDERSVALVQADDSLKLVQLFSGQADEADASGIKSINVNPATGLPMVSLTVPPSSAIAYIVTDSEG